MVTVARMRRNNRGFRPSYDFSLLCRFLGLLEGDGFADRKNDHTDDCCVSNDDLLRFTFQRIFPSLQLSDTLAS